MHLKILSPSRLIFEGEVDMVSAPGELGELGILPGHTPLLSKLKGGEVRAKIGAHQERHKINGGFVEVLHNKVVVVAEEIQEG